MKKFLKSVMYALLTGDWPSRAETGSQDGLDPCSYEALEDRAAHETGYYEHTDDCGKLGSLG